MKTTKDDTSRMQRYGITCEVKSIYRYKQFQYDKLQDAINYAKLDDDNHISEIKYQDDLNLTNNSK